jgi:phosphate transport system protein
MTTHLEQSLQGDFDRVQARIASMSDFAIEMLQDCVTAFRNGDRERASLIILRDQRVDFLESEIDRLCLQFLVRHQPAGAHLRFAYSALQINFELERIGDYAESIARQVIKLMDLGCRIPTDLYEDITSTSIAMLRNAVNAFVRQDASLAEATEQIEERVDAVRDQINRELTHLVQTNQLPLAALTPLMTIARRFERVSDQAKGICQETLYLCTGEYAKHAGAHLCRVLFVDNRHGCLGRIAAAIGNGLGHAGVHFSSAGLAPEPLSAEISAFLKEKGLSSSPPQPLGEAPDLSQYQLVIAFSPDVVKQLPAPSRKAVQLQWAMADPCGPGEADGIRQACEEAYRTLSKRLSELVRTLTGEPDPKH